MRRFGGMVATTTTWRHWRSAPAVAAPRRRQRTAQRLGVQLVPKHHAGKSANAFSNARGREPLDRPVAGPGEGRLGLLAVGDEAAVGQARREAGGVAQGARRRAAARRRGRAGRFRGGNDTHATAQRIPAFGSAAGQRPAARILGTLAPLTTRDVHGEPRRTTARSRSAARPADRERQLDATDGDDRRRAARQGGDGTGDFDFYASAAPTRGSGSSSTSTPRPATSTRSSSSTTPPGTWSRPTTTAAATSTAC